MLFMHSIPIPSRVKVAALRAFGAKVGKGVVIRSRVEISFPWRLELGDFVWIGNDVTLLSLAAIRIGSHCCLSQRAFLCSGSHDFRKTTFDLVVNPIVVNDGCWIAANSFVAPGVTFGSGSMCAAYSVVVKDVEPMTIVGGNPAKLINRVVSSS